MSLLEIRNLKCWYGDIPAVKEISLEVGNEEIVALIGANGAGKSTILLAISGLVPKTQGEIVFQQQPILGLSPAEIVKKGVVHIPEGRRIFPRLTVEENLRLSAFLNPSPSEISQKMEQVFEKFPVLAERRKQKAGTLSGGEQQMLAIARALMQKPRLLLCDEPSLGLAPRLLEEIYRILMSIYQSGISILLVEQNAHKALHFAHRAYLLETGKIVLSAPSQEFLQNPMVKKAYLGEI